MKLTSFRHLGGQSFGAVVEGGIFDLGARLAPRFPDLRSLLGDAGALADVKGMIAGAKPDFRDGNFDYLPVIPNPDKIFCVGLNYRAHVEETGRTETTKPVIFFRVAACQIGHEQPIIRPRVSDKLDFEGEVAVIIGKPGRHIPLEKAYEHVAGYACYNDGSVRDWQMHTGQMGPGKNFKATGAFGPWMVTADEVPDPAKLELTTRLNGQVMQNTTLDKLIFSIPELINYVSTFIELESGDVIVSGTPGGVGVKRDPQVFMKPGDIVEIEVSQVGILRNSIADEA